MQVGRDLISRVTDGGDGRRARVGASGPWRTSTRSIFLDALVLEDPRGRGRCSAAPAISRSGITVDGDRDVLGMWFQETEGAKFWMQVLSELKQRGVRDILICCVDGLKGFPEAIEAIFPRPRPSKHALSTSCAHSLKYVPRREREQVARDLKPIYTAVDADAAQAELERFDEKWGPAVPGDHPGVAERLGVRDPVPGVPARGPPRDLHHG